MTARVNTSGGGSISFDPRYRECPVMAVTVEGVVWHEDHVSFLTAMARGILQVHRLRFKIPKYFVSLTR